MPKREDERGRSEESQQRYCAKHERFYLTQSGCLDCRMKRFGELDAVLRPRWKKKDGLRRGALLAGLVVLLVGLSAFTATAVGAFDTFVPPDSPLFRVKSQIANTKEMLAGSLRNFGVGEPPGLDINVIGFVADNGSRVGFITNVQKNERTTKGAEYLIELVGDGKVLDSGWIRISSTGAMMGSTMLQRLWASD